MKTPIDVLMDCQHVKRWSMVGTNKESNVASHSFNVAVIAMAIAKKMPLTGDPEHSICYYAITHDVAEAYTGDIPTPTKTRMKKEGFNPDAMEGMAQEEVASEHFQKIIKAADLIDNYVFIREHAVGARGRWAAKEVEGRLSRYLSAASPELQAAASEVLGDILERKNDAVVEREEAQEDRKKVPGILYLF